MKSMAEPPNNHNKNKQIAHYVKDVIIVLAAILVVLIIFLVIDYRALRHAQIMHDHQSFLASILAHHAPLNANDVGAIRPWMTFDYVDTAFRLPPAYLAAQLPVADARYPQLTISGYAKTAHLDLTTVLNRVEGAVRAYFTTSTPASATSTNAAIIY